jgi:transposase
MYIRSRKNASGSTSVFIVDSRRVKGKTHSQSIMVKSFGSSADPEKIEAMLAQAQEYKLKLQQAKIVAHKKLTLSIPSDLSSCTIQTTGTKELYGSIFQQFFSSVNLPKLNKQILEDIAVMRIAKPMSKYKTSKEFTNFGCSSFTPNQIYRFMDSLNDKNIGKLKQAIYQNTKQILGDKEQVDVLFYDLTTIYFETNNQDAIRDFGFSKDGKHQHVQITMALMVTKHGLPVGYELFPGNVFEGHTLIPVLSKLRKEYKIDKVSIVADSALMNNINLTDLEQNDFGYIVAARVKSMNKQLTQEMLDQEGYRGYGEDMRYKVIKLENRYLVTVFSEQRARKDAYDRVRSIEKAQKHIGSSVKGKLSGSLKKSYFVLSKDCKILLDEEKIAKMEKLDGYFGFYTNEDASPEDIIAQYRGLWQVEQSFRISKHNLKIRPVYHWNTERIKAHFAICFLSLSLIRYTEFLLKQSGNQIPIEKLQQMLERVQIVRIISKGEVFYIRSDMPKELILIYDILHIKRPKSFMHSSQM